MWILVSSRVLSDPPVAESVSHMVIEDPSRVFPKNWIVSGVRLVTGSFTMMLCVGYGSVASVISCEGISFGTVMLILNHFSNSETKQLV